MSQARDAGRVPGASPWSNGESLFARARTWALSQWPDQEILEIQRIDEDRVVMLLDVSGPVTYPPASPAPWGDGPLAA